MTRPEPGLARGKWEAPRVLFFGVIAIVALFAVVAVLARLGVVRLPARAPTKSK